MKKLTFYTSTNNVGLKGDHEYKNEKTIRIILSQVEMNELPVEGQICVENENPLHGKVVYFVQSVDFDPLFPKECNVHLSLVNKDLYNHP